MDYFKKHPSATVIGENTKGAFHFIDTGIYVLPQSRMVLKMGLSYAEQENGTYTGKEGISPELAFDELDSQTKFFINAFIQKD